MVRIEETSLPGVGRRFDFDAEYGKRVGVITHRDGKREIFVAQPEDPDACAAAIVLAPDEAEAVADMLGGSTVTRKVTSLTNQIEGLAIDWITLEPHSTSVGQRLADSDLRSKTGASIVAILSHGQANPAPGPDDVLHAGDVLVVVGGTEGVLQAAEYLNGHR